MKWLRYMSYAGAVVNVLFYLSVLVATLAYTAPAPGQSFLEAVTSPRMQGAFRLTLPIASMSLVLDVYILLLPIAAVSRLQLSKKRKFGVMIIFFTGSMWVLIIFWIPIDYSANIDYRACVASSLSIYYKWKLDRNTLDVTYETMPVLVMRSVLIQADKIWS